MTIPGLDTVIAKIYAATMQASEPPFPCDVVAELLAPADVQLDRQEAAVADEVPISHRLCADLLTEPLNRVMLTAIRSTDGPGFSSSEARLFKLLALHFQKAMRIRQRLDQSELAWRGACATLDRLATGYVLSEANNRIVFANRRAGELLASHATFASAGQSLLTNNDGQGKIGSATLLAAVRPDPPASELHALAAPTPTIWGVTADPAPSLVPQEILMQMYGLTPAEAATLNALLDGHGLKHAASCLGISTNTAKTHLARILAKTGAPGQSALIRLVLMGPAILRWR